MSTSTQSVGEIQETLEKLRDHHRNMVDLLTKRVEYHRVRLEESEESLKSFASAIEAARKAMAQAELASALENVEVVEAAFAVNISAEVASTVETLETDREFDAPGITPLVNERLATRGAMVDEKQVSNVLRRMLADRKLRLVQEGRPRYPARYSKLAPAGDGRDHEQVEEGQPMLTMTPT